MNKKAFFIAVASSTVIIIMVLTINILTSWDTHPWFVYPAYAVLWWPLACIAKKSPKLFSIIGGLGTALFLWLINRLTSPETVWAVYAFFPFAWWPIATFLPKQKTLMPTLAALCCYYGIINILVEPSHPWVIYIIFPAIIVAACVNLAKKKQYLIMSIAGSVFAIIFFITINIVTSAYTFWAIYPSLGVLFWPLSVYFFGKLSLSNNSKDG
ncbi:MAG: hypothetical protein WCD89_17075 [Anaerocolumna sp.]